LPCGRGTFDTIQNTRCKMSYKTSINRTVKYSNGSRKSSNYCPFNVCVGTFPMHL